MTDLAVMHLPAQAGPLALPSPSDFEAYARAVNQVPLLTEAEEARLAWSWRCDEDRQAAWALVVAHLRLVVRVARDHRGYGLPLGDLAQEGTVGLMRAVRKFDPAQGVRLGVYALRWIEAEIREFIFRNWRLVRLGSSHAMKKLFFGYRQTVHALQGLGERRTIPMEELAEALDVTVEQLQQAEGFFRGKDLMEGLPPEAGADEAQEGRWDRWVQGALPDPTRAEDDVQWTDDPAEQWAQARDQHDQAQQLQHALARLPERDRAILTARRLQEPPAGLKELSKTHGISMERVRQIEARSLERLSQWLTDPALASPALPALASRHG